MNKNIEWEEPPNSLFKYYSFDDGGYNLSVIENGEVWFSNPKDFNDPFDCTPYVDARKQAIENCKDPSFRKKAAVGMGLSDSHITSHRSEIEKQVEKNIRKNFLDDQVLKKVAGIFCLTESPLNILMWSHYADKHTGFMLEFDQTINTAFCKNPSDLYEANLKLLKPLMKIQYQNDMPELDMYRLSDDEIIDDLRNMYFYKSLDWAYEHEWRCLDNIYIRQQDPENNPLARLIPYDRKRILKSVIAGCEISDENNKKLASVIKKVNDELGCTIALHKATKVPKQYAIEVVDRPDLTTIQNNLSHQVKSE